MKKINLNLSLKSIGIKPSDIFIIHMDAGAVAQFNYKKSIVNSSHSYADKKAPS